MGARERSRLSTGPFRILCLDGGGAKGVYSLGVLSALEKAAPNALHVLFDAVYGVSTGAIIGALVAVGKSAQDIHSAYECGIPSVLRRFRSAHRSASLRAFAERELGETRFEDVKTRLAVVCLNRRLGRPLIFKSSADIAHGGHDSFVPGFGIPIAKALCASSAAFPLFHPVAITAPSGDSYELIDGGFVANNPTLLAVADAVGPLALKPSELRVVSIGVGHYKERRLPLRASIPNVLGTTPWRLISEMMDSSSLTTEFMRQTICANVPAVRVDGDYTHLAFETNLLETRPDVLKALFHLGQDAFHANETQLMSALRE